MFFKAFAILLLWMQHSSINVNIVGAENTTVLTNVVPEFVAYNATQQIMHFEDFDNADADTEVVEALSLPEVAPTDTSSPAKPLQPTARTGRQLLYSPQIAFLQRYGEGSQCITTRGEVGACVGYNSCQQYLRFRRQLTFYAVPPQWPQFSQQFCSYYDIYGRPNSGVCCTTALPDGSTGGNPFGFVPLGPTPVQPPVRPPFVLPAHPIQPAQPVPPPPPAVGQNPDREDAVDEDEDGDDGDTIEIESNEQQGSGVEFAAVASMTAETPAKPATTPAAENSEDYEPIVEQLEHEDDLPVPVTYDDRFEWPIQFAGHFGGLAQWPPAVPTHAPTIGSWPPPVPTHPPGHHYPTHPPSSHVTPTKPSSSAKPMQTTKKTSTTTTTRRPTTQRPTSQRPSYPSYPAYPGYPSYPGYYPSTTTTRRPSTFVTTARPTTTTSRRPISSASGGNSPQGLPLQCGIKNPESGDQERIVGGINASPNEFPWIAVLFKSGKQFCGGSLVTKDHIITAAHCVARMTSWDVAALTAHLGDYDIRTDFEVQHVQRRIKRLVRHKGFEFSTLHNDIAILTLNEPVKFTYEIQPICLPTSNAQIRRSYSGQVATVAGWGSLRENGPQPAILQKVQIPIWTNSECANKYGRAAPGGIIESMICAGQAAKDSCSGDSGGPLIVNDDGRYTLVGIVSWGIGCGKGQYPGVYTRTTSLLPWIYKNIKS